MYNLENLVVEKLGNLGRQTYGHRGCVVVCLTFSGGVSMGHGTAVGGYGAVTVMAGEPGVTGVLRR